VVERQAQGRSFRELAADLERSGEAIAARLQSAPDTARNREVAVHVIGIERWGQLRLRVPLGEPFVLDSYRPYRPEEDASMEELRSAFDATRRETLTLARRLEANGTDPDIRVRHNDLGEVTLRGWLTYLNGHGERETRRLKG
jgi:hypothetical protein